MAEFESCRVCGGDGRVGNAFGGSSTTCPGCRGTGRRNTSESLFHDVTKTKPSHHGPSNKQAAPAKATFPSTFEGAALGKEVQSSGVSDDVKSKLIREIIEYEASHGKCTQTFSKKSESRSAPSRAGDQVRARPAARTRSSPLSLNWASALLKFSWSMPETKKVQR
ncbi:MAG: molecular chaperone DnaJ [Polyangiaceae bacterium]